MKRIKLRFVIVFIWPDYISIYKYILRELQIYIQFVSKMYGVNTFMKQKIVNFVRKMSKRRVIINNNFLSFSLYRFQRKNRKKRGKEERWT